MRTQLMNYLRAGYPGIVIVSTEEVRVEAEMHAIAESLGFGLYVWSINEGLIDFEEGVVKNADDPLQALECSEELPEQSILLLPDFHMFLDAPDPVLIRAMKRALRIAKTSSRSLVIVSCCSDLPPELEREFVVAELPLPGKEELKKVLDNISESAGKPCPEGEECARILDSACGLTVLEAENAFALSVVEAGEITPAVVSREKAVAVKKNGILEIVPAPASLDDVGGLDVLKQWLVQRAEAFGERAAQYGLPAPKGLMIIGIPGTGKSLTAKATASVFQCPLLRLDTGRVYAGLVGQSEANLRSVIATTEAIAPCVLWIDEIEKAFSGSQSSGQTDGGTSSRVLGSFLSWLQEKTSPVFVVATANDVRQLPSELLRKGRFDEVFYVDLPCLEERVDIWNIQINNYGRGPEDFDVDALAAGSEGLTGSEIEQVFRDTLYCAFSSGREPSMADVNACLKELVPLSQLMGEQVTALRKWAQGRARPAATQKAGKAKRKILY